MGSADGSLWTVRDWGVVHQPAVAALRRVLNELPAGDSDLRCRVARAHLLTLRAVAAMETGRMTQMWRDVAAARAEAERLRLPFPLGVLNGMETPPHAMQGRFPEAEELLAEAAELASRTSLPTGTWRWPPLVVDWFTELRAEGDF